MKQQSRSGWETVIIAASFVAVWIYFLAWVWAGRNQTPLSSAWQLLLLPALLAMLFIFARRSKRVLRSLKGEDDGEGNNGATPMNFPPTNGHRKK